MTKWLRAESMKTESLALISRALGVSAHWLVTGEGQRELQPESPAIEAARQEGRAEALILAHRAIEGIYLMPSPGELERLRDADPNPPEREAAR